MSEKLTINSLRTAIKKRSDKQQDDRQATFEAVATRLEKAVAKIIGDIHKIVTKIPELTVVLEDEKEVFTSPAYPGKEMEIKDKRLRITLEEDYLLFDPTAKAAISSLGQIEIASSRPLPFLIEKVLYLVPDAKNPQRANWCYRSMENMGRTPLPFTQQALLKLLQAVFG